ncbi:alpha/beta fold hydrolase [Kineosporia succinea]|uniref:Pimeloyl-ACP methyl ester carboxylesterase n=1 Tax=Kineosporia succinea TaxID=84632 RepID=A0ABT9PE05_9ACTN|nr:alpha/beta hydrolase [Kineosporia succinea]MDP9830210.1 pimeloyl-ACP methyl ester carboxylesterase [Kineosporia succinea]
MEQLIQKQVAVPGSWIGVDVYGEADGPAIMVIPGAMADASGWARVARNLGPWATVAVVNRRGRRPSGPLTDEYGVGTEVSDAMEVLKTFGDVRAVFGWSYGGLIALHLAGALDVPHVIAYEPVVAPFGVTALPDLRRAQEQADPDARLRIALEQVAGLGRESVARLRDDGATWAELMRLAAPAYYETLAINEAPPATELAVRARRIDLIIGGRNRGRAPYGSSFADVERLVPGTMVHELGEQGHLAHLEAPRELADLVNRLGSEAG